eukprot:scaffold5.g679.t1
MVLTSGLVETHLISCLGFSAALLYVGRIVEPLHGSQEYARFLAVATAGTGALTLLAVTFVYYAGVSAEKKSEEGLDRVGAILYTPICGFHGAFAALLVALKQLLPDSEVAVLGGLVRCRVKHLPSIYVALMCSLSAALHAIAQYAPFVLFGTYCAWLYLRFVKPDSSGLRGDPSEDFKFASFFPPPAQPAVDRVSGAVARVARLGSAHGEAGGAGAGGAPYSLAAGSSGTALAPDGGDAARRRERGARALEERLGLKAKAAAAAAAAGGSSGGGGAAPVPAPAANLAPEAPAATAAADTEAPPPADGAEAAPAAPSEAAAEAATGPGAGAPAATGTLA